MADNQRSTGRFDMRWAVYALAVAVVLLDQWSKDLVVEHLASPAHPMVLVGDGEVTVLLGHPGGDDVTGSSLIEAM